MKKTILVRVSYLVNVDESEINYDSDVEGLDILDKLTYKLQRNRYFSIDGKNIKMEYDMTSATILDSEKMNCGRCSECNSWVTDVDKAGKIDGLCPGAVVDGKLHCAEHLDLLFNIKKS